MRPLKCCYKLLGPSGGSLGVLGVFLASFRPLNFSFLAYGREQKCVKRMLAECYQITINIALSKEMIAQDYTNITSSFHIEYCK